MPDDKGAWIGSQDTVGGETDDVGEFLHKTGLAPAVGKPSEDVGTFEPDDQTRQHLQELYGPGVTKSPHVPKLPPLEAPPAEVSTPPVDVDATIERFKSRVGKTPPPKKERPAAVSKADLKAMVAEYAQTTVTYMVRLPGENGKPKTFPVQIRPLSAAEIYGHKAELEFQKAGVKSKVPWEAQEQVGYVILGTVDPPLEWVADREWLHGLPFSTIMEWSQAIQRLSGNLSPIRWDEETDKIVNPATDAVIDLIRQMLVEPLQADFTDEADLQVKAVLNGMLRSQVEEVLRIAVARGDSLGQDRICAGGNYGAESREEVGNVSGQTPDA